MIELREAQDGRDTPLTADEILSQVLGESRGFLPGWGRRLPNSTFASSSCSAHSHLPTPPMMFQEAWARSFVANQDQISQIYQLSINNNMQVPMPTLLNPAQFIDVVQDAPEDDVAPGDE
ncbi:hypothetical protein Tco_0993064 [Tanacetum coccineum]|uniref:Uncharacterized protein n=1 Tax=Tanacetum coccineum TaxID=301880 RepID=A0ABQ5F4A4_9ASTR